MRFAEIQSRVTALLEALPAQQRLAAKPLLDHPDDVALLSMRELARRAGVPPATMTRLAQRLGFEGFEYDGEERARMRMRDLAGGNR